MDALRGVNPIEAKACEAGSRWDRLDTVWDDREFFSDAGILPADFENKRNEVLKSLSSSVVAAVNADVQLSCFANRNGDQRVDAMGSVEAVEKVVEALKNSDLKPESIGLSSQQLRSLHLKALKKGIPSFIEMWKESKDQQIAFQIDEYLSHWNYPAEELGIGAEDLAEIKKANEYTGS